MVGYIRHRPISAKEIDVAVQDHPLGPWFAATATQIDDGKIADRRAWLIAKLIGEIGATATVHDEGSLEKNGLTKAEASFVGRFPFSDRDGVVALMKDDGWSRRRIQKELVSLLRLLISLDPDYLRQYDVAIVADELDEVDGGRRLAEAAVLERLSKFDAAGEDGFTFRHGLALGLRLAGENKEAALKIQAAVDADLGLSAPDDRRV